MPSSKDIIKEQVDELLTVHYLSPIKLQVETELTRMNQIVEAVRSHRKLDRAERESNEKLAGHKLSLRSEIEGFWTAPEERSFLEVYDSMQSAFDGLLKAIPYSEKRAQSKDRFLPLPDDSFRIKSLKLGKRILLSISKTLNGRSKRATYPPHKIPVRNLSKHHFQNGLILDLQELTKLFFTSLCKMALEVKHWEESQTGSNVSSDDESVDIEKKLKQFRTRLLKELKDKLSRVLDSRMAMFLQDYEVAGTVEFPNKKLADKVLQEELVVYDKRWSRHNYLWKNTIYALFEEWRSDLEIFSLKHKSQAAFEEFQSAQLRRLSEHVDPEIEAIIAFIDESQASLAKGSPDELSMCLKKISYQAGKKLDMELIPRLKDKLTSQNISSIISKLEMEISRSVEALSNEYVIVKTSTYDQPIYPDELKKIAPSELISFEALLAFEGEIEEVKKSLFTTLEGTAREISDVASIISFSSDSAATLLEEEHSTESAVKICEEGLERAKNRVNEKRELLTSSMKSNADKLAEIVEKFCDQLMELTVNENVGELRRRISSAKAAIQAEQLRQKYRRRLLTGRRKLTTAILKAFQKVRALVRKASERFVLTASKPVITRQVADFLMESQVLINSLPLIYRRLFKIEPLEDLELFEGRRAEIKQLNGAFDNWKQGRYAGTVVVGEKWGGLTSFLNYALRTSNFPYSVTRFSSKSNISTEAELVQMLKDMFQEESLNTVDEFADSLNAGGKRIIVLEDLQNLYLKKVDGFRALQALFKLMNLTHGQVFWVSSITMYAWQYLSKAINIDEFFSYTIKMGALTNDQIVNVIWKRNRISGYNVYFQAPPSYLEDRKFKKLTEAEQQRQLKEEYFTSLNEFAKSNISLALIFWLLSTKKVDASTITIGSFVKPDLSFVSVISMEKVYVIHALILHDGLNEQQVKEVLNTTTTSADLNLLALLEDGVIIKAKDLYLVNPMVYRNMISLLKAKNLIH